MPEVLLPIFEIGAEAGAVDAGIGAAAAGAADAAAGAAIGGAVDAGVGAAVGDVAAGAAAADVGAGIGEAAAFGGAAAGAGAELGVEGAALGAEAAGAAGAGDIAAAAAPAITEAGTGGAAAAGAGLGGFVAPTGAAELSTASINALTGASSLGGAVGADAGLAGGLATAADLAAPASVADIGATAGFGETGAAIGGGSSIAGAGEAGAGLSTAASSALNGGEFSGFAGASELSAAPAAGAAEAANAITLPEISVTGGADATGAAGGGIGSAGNIAAGDVPGGLADVNSQFALAGETPASETGAEFSQAATPGVATDAPTIPATSEIGVVPYESLNLPPGTPLPPGPGALVPPGEGSFNIPIGEGGIPAAPAPAAPAGDIGGATAGGVSSGASSSIPATAGAAGIPSAPSISSLAGAPMGAAAGAGAIGASLMEPKVGSSATGTISDVTGNNTSANNSNTPGARTAVQNSDAISSAAQQKGWSGNGSTFTTDNIGKLMQQESGGQNLPPNKYGYTGYFQMRPENFTKSGQWQDRPTSDRMTAQDFKNMSFDQQLQLYTNRLQFYGYNGTQDLGMMNAAPNAANRPDASVVYPAGSAAANANPQWRQFSNADGNVTVGGIKAWFQAGGTGGSPAAVAASAPYEPLPGGTVLGQGGIGSDVGMGPPQNSGISTIPVQQASLPAAQGVPGMDIASALPASPTTAVQSADIGPAVDTTDTFDRLVNGKQLSPGTVTSSAEKIPGYQLQPVQVAGAGVLSDTSPLPGSPVGTVEAGGDLAPATSIQEAMNNPIYGLGSNPAVPVDASTLQVAGTTPNVPANLPEGGFPGDAVSSLPGSPVGTVESGGPLAATQEPPLPGQGGIGSDYAASGGTGPGANYAPAEPPVTAQATPPTAAAPSTVSQPTQQALSSTTAPAANAPASTSNLWGNLSPVAKSALMAAPGLVVAGINLSKGPQNQAEMEALQAQAARDQALYQQQIDMFNAGQIPPGEQLTIEQWLKDQKNKINQEYSAMNRYQSTDRLKAIQGAEGTATAEFHKFLDQELQTANLASNQAAQDLANAAKIQAANDQAYSNALISALGGIGKVAATGVISAL